MAYRDPARQLEYARKHYRQHKAAYLERNNKRRAEMRAYVRELKESTSCADCKNDYPHYVMDFDHRDTSTKCDIVSKLMSNLSWKRLREEIEKCDIVCANCHRIRTFARRVATAQPKIPVPNEDLRAA
jgi:hypothetical protein